MLSFHSRAAQPLSIEDPGWQASTEVAPDSPKTAMKGLGFGGNSFALAMANATGRAGRDGAVVRRWWWMGGWGRWSLAIFLVVGRS